MSIIKFKESSYYNYVPASLWATFDTLLCSLQPLQVYSLSVYSRISGKPSSMVAKAVMDLISPKCLWRTLAPSSCMLGTRVTEWFHSHS